MPVDLSLDLTARLSVSDFFVGRSGSHFTVRQPESNFNVGRCESNIVRMLEALFLQRMRSVPSAFDFLHVPLSRCGVSPRIAVC